MNYKETTIKAQLVEQNERIPIDATYASKYSLFVRFLNGKSFGDGAEFSKLIFPVDEDNAELGPCQLIAEPNIDGYAGRLIFLNDVYDFNNLISNKKIVKLQNSFANLPLILSRKTDLDQRFKDYTADLTYDLSVYKNMFDTVDMEQRKEPENVRQFVQQAIIHTEGEKFMLFLDDRLKELERIVCDFTKEEHEQHGFYFRKQLWDYIMCSPFMTRTNLKPRGYAGDSEMMKMIYLKEYHGESTFSKLMHRHPIEHPAAQAVRNRRDLIVRMISELRDNSPTLPKKKLKVLSVACGPAFEMNDILGSADDCEKYHFTLLDQDRHALFEAAELMDQIERYLNAKIHVDYLNESVRMMLVTPELQTKWGQFNFIYSMGLFDYLTPPVARAVIKKLFGLLSPGGEMIIGNFHVSNPSKCYMEYWLDWVLYYRTEQEFRNLLGDIPSAKVDVCFEDTRSQMFLHVKRLE